MENLKLKRPTDRIQRKCYKYLYYIYDGKIKVGEIDMKKSSKYMIIGFITIYKDYRMKGYGKAVIQYIFDKYKIEGIIGESLNKVVCKKFWNHIINLYGGKKYGVTWCSNTAWSFVIKSSGEFPDINFVKDCVIISANI